MNLSLSGLEKFKDLGLLVLRVVVGLTFVHYGWDKLIGGTSSWSQVGSAMGRVGVDFGAMYWGLAATFAELIGGLLLIVGVCVRLSAMALCGTMVVATILMSQSYSFSDIGSAIKVYYPASMTAVTFALIFLGGGKFSMEGSGGGSRSSSDSSKKK